MTAPSAPGNHRLPAGRARRPGARAWSIISLALCLTAPAAGAPWFGGRTCVWSPPNDVPAVQRLVEDWATATGLPPFDALPWDLTIDMDSARLLLRFVKGTLTVAWTIDQRCQPTGVTIQASPDFEGSPPNPAAAQRLVTSLRAVADERHVESPRPTLAELRRRLLTPPAVALLIVLGTLVAGLVSVAAGGWRAAARAVAARVGLVLLGTGLGLAILEVTLRAIRFDDRIMGASLFFLTGDSAEHQTSADPFLHYELAPDTRTVHQDLTGRSWVVQVDSFGARLPTHEARKAPGTFRVLCFGGSTLFGAGVNDDETIAAAMERRLNHPSAQTHPPRFEVWNFGTSAYNLAQATHLARTQLKALSPDLILVQIHNNFSRPFFLPSSIDPGELLRRMERVDPALLDEQFPIPSEVPPAIHHLAIRHWAAYRSLIGAYRRYDRSKIPYSERLAQDEARALVFEVAARGVAVVFVAIPVDLGRFGAAAGVFPELPASQFLDLYRPGREPEFYEVHPPARVLDQYAELLGDELRARGLIPSVASR